MAKHKNNYCTSCSKKCSADDNSFKGSEEVHSTASDFDTEQLIPS